MCPLPDPLRDPARLEALRETALLDSPSEESFDRLTRVAARMLRTPFAFVSLVDGERQFTKSAHAPPDWPNDAEAPLPLCRRVVATGAPVVAEELADTPLFDAAASASGAALRSYLGVPILGTARHILGSLGVADLEPRAWIDEDVGSLQDLSALVTSEIVLRAELREREDQHGMLRAATEEAERANRARTELVSRMSHELRTPLNAILGFGQLLEMEMGSEGDRESVEQILRAGRHLLQLIDDVLDIARVESRRTRLAIEPVSTRSVIEQCVSLMRGLAAEREVELRVDLDDGDLEAWADEQRLRQVLLNLISNAINFNRAGGTVTLTCRTLDNSRVCIGVRDTGKGIPPAGLERLFLPFERSDAASGRHGTGLGLALSKALVEAMGGTLRVESAEGEGSTFLFDLPAVAPPESSPAPPAGTVSQEPSDAARTRTVVLIEDNLTNSKLIGHIFQRRPEISLLSAMQGRRGLELARHHRPDLVILDLNLPDLPGDEVLAEIRRDERLRDTPVLMISGGADESDVERARSLGATAFLMKPFNLEDFLRVVDESLRPAAP